MTKSYGHKHDQKILDFCKGGKTPEEVGEHLGINTEHIRNLVKQLYESGLIEKRKQNAKLHGKTVTYTFYLTAGTEFNHPPIPDKGEAPSAPKWNDEFVRVMHRILYVGAA